jgi:hypothetical protein
VVRLCKCGERICKQDKAAFQRPELLVLLIYGPVPGQEATEQMKNSKTECVRQKARWVPLPALC